MARCGLRTSIAFSPRRRGHRARHGLRTSLCISRRTAVRGYDGFGTSVSLRKKGHDRIADELVDDAVVLFDRIDRSFTYLTSIEVDARHSGLSSEWHELRIATAFVRSEREGQAQNAVR